MAHHKSAIKRIKTNERDRQNNSSSRSRMRTLIKNVLGAKDSEQGQKAFVLVTSVLDKMARKGIIHANKAANQKSRLARHLNKLA